jgi:hypothetical protein
VRFKFKSQIQTVVWLGYKFLRGQALEETIYLINHCMIVSRTIKVNNRITNHSKTGKLKIRLNNLHQWEIHKLTMTESDRLTLISKDQW